MQNDIENPKGRAGRGTLFLLKGYSKFLVGFEAQRYISIEEEKRVSGWNSAYSFFVLVKISGWNFSHNVCYNIRVPMSVLFHPRIRMIVMLDGLVYVMLNLIQHLSKEIAGQSPQ